MGSRPFKRGGGARRRDVAEQPIREALQAVGAECWQIGGTGLPDLLVRFRGRFYAGEVKSKGGTETEHQGAFPIWRTPDDVLIEIGAKAKPVEHVWQFYANGSFCQRCGTQIGSGHPCR